MQNTVKNRFGANGVNGREINQKSAHHEDGYIALWIVVSENTQCKQLHRAKFKYSILGPLKIADIYFQIWHIFIWNLATGL